MKRVLAVSFIIVMLMLVADSVLLGVRLYMGIKLAEKTKPFQNSPSQVGKRILIVGDSLGAGVGAEEPSRSVAGRIARDFPRAGITNASRSGARAGDILKQILAAGDGGFDVVLIQAGFDDVMKLTDPDDVRESYARLLHAALRKAPEVILMAGPDVGHAPAFSPHWRRIFSGRAEAVREIFHVLSRETDIEYVDLFRDESEDPILRDTRKYFSRDRLHLTGAGYGLLYDELKGRTSLEDILRSR